MSLKNIGRYRVLSAVKYPIEKVQDEFEKYRAL